jgi:predicted MPP superfamily phosphohydrolase
MRRSFSILILATLAFIGCTPEEQSGTTPDAFDVSLEIPAEITIGPDAESIEFKVIDGKAPESSDKMILDGPEGQKSCRILSVSSDKTTVELYENPKEGQHLVSVQRGSEIKSLGSTMFVLEKEEDEEEGGTETPPVVVEPVAGSTIYGQVTCNDVGMPGVVISDGNLVTVTDENGIYQLASDKRHGYVFISVPGGYEVPCESVFPTFYKRVSGPTTTERVDFELIPVEQDSFNVLMLGDMHLANINNDRQQFSRFVDDVKAYMQSKPGEKFYAVTLGDMTDNRYWVSKDYFFDDYKEEMKALEPLPIFHTTGNHDHRKDVGDDVQALLYYNEHLGPEYYSFNIGKVHVVVLDNLDFNHPDVGSYYEKLNDEEIEWLKKDLEYVSKDTPLFVTMHANYYMHPKTTEEAIVVQTNQATKDFNNLIEAYEEVHLFSAHSHRLWNIDNDNVFEHKCGAVCAAWWVCGYLSPGINLAKDGVPGGYYVVTVNGKDIKWQFKGTDYPVTEQFTTYDRNTMNVTSNRRVPNATQKNRQKYEAEAEYWLQKGEENEVYINVWNWDPEWKIEVKENYFRLDVEQLALKDPLYLITTIAKRFNDNDSTTGELSYTIFKVKATAPDSTLEIKVTDRFGNVYTESMKRPKAFEIETYKRY